MSNLTKEDVIKFLFFLFIVKPFIFWVLGINVRGLEKIPKDKPFIIAANHNSHIDTLILMSLFPISQILKIHPVAAKDYFCNTKFREYIFKTLVGIIPIERIVTRQSKENIFRDINEALKNNHSIIIYPEGTRGEDNTILEFKTGVAHIAKMNPDVPVIPVFINGPDKILPKLDSFIVPFISDIYIADEEYYDNSSTLSFTHKIKQIIENMYLEHKKKETL